MPVTPPRPRLAADITGQFALPCSATNSPAASHYCRRGCWTLIMNESLYSASCRLGLQLEQCKLRATHTISLAHSHENTSWTFMRNSHSIKIWKHLSGVTAKLGQPVGCPHEESWAMLMS